MKSHDDKARNFSRTELLIVACILIVMAALFGPQLTSAAHRRRENVLADQLHYLRTQILIYRAQHQNLAPGYPDGEASVPTADAFVEQMTRYTDVHGRTDLTFSGQFCYGPYLQDMPENPFTGESELIIIGADQMFPRRPLERGGWLYQPSTCTLAANTPGHDANGVSFIDY